MGRIQKKIFLGSLLFLLAICLLVCDRKQESNKISNPYYEPMLNHLKTLFSVKPQHPESLKKIETEKIDLISLPESADKFFDPDFNKYVQLSNRMIEAWNLPSPPYWEKVWEIFCSVYLSRKMGWGDNHKKLEEYIKLTLSKNAISNQIAYLLIQLFDKYDEAFFTNTIYFDRLFFKNNQNNIDNIIWSMSAAAEKDLLPFFIENGIQANRINMPISGLAFDKVLKEAEVGFLPEVRPKVLVDQAHSYNFETYHIAYFLKEYGFLGVHSDRSLRRDIFKNLDVIITHQDIVGVPYTKDEIEGIIEFVKNGGGIMLIGNKETFSRYKGLSAFIESGIFPINQLAKTFGFEFTEEKASDKLTIRYPFGLNYLKNEIINITGLSGLKVTGNGKIVLTDESGYPIMAIGEHGKGRIAVVGGTSFAKELDHLPVKRFFVSLCNWLGENSPNLILFTDHNYDDIFPDIEMHQGWDYEIEMRPDLKRRYLQRSDFIWPEHQHEINGVHILYAESMKEDVGYIINNVYPLVFKTLKIFYMCDPLSESAERIHFFPHWGSGYTWMPPCVKEPIIGIPCLSKDYDKIKGIFCHELTHAWGIPGPPVWEHCWTTFTDKYFTDKLAIYSVEQRKKNDEWLLIPLLEEDPNLDKVDISMVRLDNVDQEHIRWKKFAFMFEELSEKYGYDLLSKYIHIFRKYGKVDKESLSISDLVFYLSLAAGEDLYPYFIKYGTQVKRRPINFEQFK